MWLLLKLSFCIPHTLPLASPLVCTWVLNLDPHLSHCAFANCWRCFLVASSSVDPSAGLIVQTSQLFHGWLWRCLGHFLCGHGTRQTPCEQLQCIKPLTTPSEAWHTDTLPPCHTPAHTATLPHARAQGTWGGRVGLGRVRCSRTSCRASRAPWIPPRTNQTGLRELA